MKRHNGLDMSAKAFYSPTVETRGHNSTPLQRSKTEYSAAVEAKFDLRQAQIKEAAKGKVQSHYYIVQEVLGFVEVAGETTFGGLAKGLHLNIEVVETICDYLERNKAVRYGWIQRRQLKTIKLVG